MTDPRIRWLLVPGLAAAVTPGHAAAYLSIEQAQAAMFPGAVFTPAPVTLTAAQARAIRKASGVAVRERHLRAWRVDDGGWFLVDRVLGKHEYITYAVGLTPDGRVKRVEILDYRETYGGEVAEAAWRAQFVGRAAADPVRLGSDIRNVSGATLSCRHVTDGVRRLLATYELVLR